ncbi:uncharacterized protein LOC141588433 [Silene latifolia]|uniref:uncharacterized protein LOC141588433 n=1 Tax=Silene latifolia TaxID=37657 RepID=UPI003D76EBD7
MFKLDLQKAYDSIEWSFIDQMLVALQFLEKFRKLVMCVTTPSFLSNLNGATFGFFPGRRGLRQGDPISPLLFTICMEYLSRILDFATNKWEFDIIPRAKGLNRTTCYLQMTCCCFDILQVTRFKEGALPFRYLGIPIQARRLTRHDCNILVEKIVARVRGIGARKFSYAGRLTLINSVLNTLHNYWSAIFLIPKMVIHRIVAICRKYLWDGGTEYQRAPLVAWDKVCCSKKTGGLGIKNAEMWNIATCWKIGELDLY